MNPGDAVNFAFDAGVGLWIRGHDALGLFMDPMRERALWETRIKIRTSEDYVSSMRIEVYS
jgi:hypothetical protein